MGGRGGSKAVWNFSENSSVLVGTSFPKDQSATVLKMYFLLRKGEEENISLLSDRGMDGYRGVRAPRVVLPRLNQRQIFVLLIDFVKMMLLNFFVWFKEKVHSIWFPHGTVRRFKHPKQDLRTIRYVPIVSFGVERFWSENLEDRGVGSMRCFTSKSKRKQLFKRSHLWEGEKHNNKTKNKQKIVGLLHQPRTYLLLKTIIDA